IRNNIFYDFVSNAINATSLILSGSCTVDHNLVYSPSGSVGVLSTTATGCVPSQTKVNVNPRFVNESGYDFHLAPGSPAIDAGAAVPGLASDFAGAPRPQGAAFDLGA